MEKITTVMVELGTYTLGQTTTDGNGNVVRQVPSSLDNRPGWV